MSMIRFVTLAVLSSLLSGSIVFAAEGEPLAIRFWADHSVSLETQWGLTVVVAETEAPAQEQADRQLTFRSNVNHSLSRAQNSSTSTWKSWADGNADPNAIHLSSLLENGGQSAALMAEVDGVRIVFVSGGKSSRFTALPKGEIGTVDAIVLPAKIDSPTSVELVRWINLLNPRFILAGKNASEAIQKESLNADEEVIQIGHNTFAISHSTESEQTPHLVQMTTNPWEMPKELKALFTAMELSCDASQQVFAKLSAEQLNFKPANGTHTPRWNAEHMMGRQLGFFSQIYHAVDPVIPEMNLNPKQMPPDYSAAHPAWDGSEEARQMQRVSEFTRRYAYLLRDVELDRKAPGSRWTLRALLRQMDRHYQQHTANTVKKFELPDWPKL